MPGRCQAAAPLRHEPGCDGARCWHARVLPLRNPTCRLVRSMETRSSKFDRIARMSHARSISLLAVATATVSFGALAVGALAIGRLAVGKARIRSLKIDHLDVKRLDLAGIKRRNLSDSVDL